MNRLKKNIVQIYFEILKEPRNAERRVRSLMNFFRYKLFYKHFNYGLRSVVFPNHDEGEVNIWTFTLEKDRLPKTLAFWHKVKIFLLLQKNIFIDPLFQTKTGVEV